MKGSKRLVSLFLAIMLAASIMCLGTANVSASTNQFRGVNWADTRDNFLPGVIYVSGLSSSDTYSSAATTAGRIMDEFMSKLGVNSVRLPINEATVSSYWGTYTGAIDTVLSKGKVILCYWSNTFGAKPADMNAFWNMRATVTSKYGSNSNCYFEIYNEPNAYSKTDLGNLYDSWLKKYTSIPKNRVILDGTGMAQNVSDMGSDSRFNGCLLAVHEYSMWGATSWTTESQWINQFKGYVGNYADRTVCTEWGGPMSPGSKNGISYGYQDYNSAPGSYFVAYVRGITSQLRSWNMGSFYWAGLKDADWYSMTTKSGSGSGITLNVSNQSGLDRMKYSWGDGGPTPTPTPSTATPTPTPSTATATPTPSGATATPVPTATPTPSGSTPAPGGIKVQFFNGNTAATTNTIYPNFKVVNTGTASVNLSDVKVRYYFTNDGTQGDSFACDYSTIGAGNVTGTFTTVAKTNADRYLEVGFTSSAGTLAAGAGAEVKSRVWKSDWSNFTQTNDYSFNATATNYVDATTVTGYIAGALKWGTEP